MNAKLKILKQYVKLRNALETEREQLKARLQEIQEVLGTEAGGGEIPAPLATAPVRRGPGRPKGRRKMSPANKAKLIAGIKARWARYRAEKGLAAPVVKRGPGRPRKIQSLIAPAVAPEAPARKKHKMSAAGRAAIRAAVKARWAKVRAAKAK